MSSAVVTERAISEMLAASCPARLHDRLNTEEAKEWVRDHLSYYDDEKVHFPDQLLLPWSNMIGYDDDWDEAFFVILVLRAEAIELFCGTGYWPDVRTFGEGEAEEIPAADLHRAWAARFHVPCPPLALGKAAVKEWLGREW